MTLRQILLIFAARYKLALLVAIAIIAVAVPIIERLPKRYTASASLVVDIRAPDPISAMLRPSSMATQEDIIKSERVSQRVVKLLKLDENPTARQQWRDATDGQGRVDAWLAELLQRNLTVTPPRRDSNVLTIEYMAAEPAFAAAVVNAFARAYVDISVELKVEPAKQYAQWFAEQSKTQRESLERAQARLSEFQQKRGIVAKDESVDTETARLTELSSQLTALQAQTADARSKRRLGSDTLPEVQQNPIIVGLRNEIVRHEVRLKDAAGNLGKNHPRYRSMQAELAELRSKLESESGHVTQGFVTSSTVGNEKERELKVALEAQKRKLLQLRSERDQLAVLQRDVDAAKNAYDAVVSRYTQASLESQATQTNVFLLNPAVEPLEPSTPKKNKFMLIAVLFGLAAGVAAAFGMELLDRRIRCADDLAAMLPLPVLTVVPHLRGPTAKPARLRVLWRPRQLPAPWAKT